MHRFFLPALTTMTVVSWGLVLWLSFVQPAGTPARFCTVAAITTTAVWMLLSIGEPVLLAPGEQHRRQRLWLVGFSTAAGLGLAGLGVWTLVGPPTTASRAATAVVAAACVLALRLRIRRSKDAWRDGYRQGREEALADLPYLSGVRDAAADARAGRPTATVRAGRTPRRLSVVRGEVRREPVQ
ncbi:hypothetical protein [Kineococcus terrestris]|uniref:hypothetical protein n=1 Tax=Kineococcus terrestris TaxID=2044856 RepID=UPI0034DB3E26